MQRFRRGPGRKVSALVSDSGVVSTVLPPTKLACKGAPLTANALRQQEECPLESGWLS